MLFTVALSLLSLVTSVVALPKSTNPQPLGRAQDDSPALIYAFSVCSNKATIELPGHYTVGRVLNTTLTDVDINLTGTIQYTADMAYWSPASIFLTYQNATTFWLLSGTGITLSGGGTIDANGQIWWEQFARSGNAGVAGGSSRTFSRPVPLTVGFAKDVLVKDIAIVNSPFWLPTIKTANSDGWDIYRSDHVTIKNSWINNQDDCVSFKPNSTFVDVQNLWCNGSHGISVGSLGQYAGETDIVANVFVKNITMLNAQQGARIKVFGGSNDTQFISGGGDGYVKNITFSDFYIENTDTPILIDQCYMTTAAQCKAYPATLRISDVHYINIKGTSSGKLTNGTVVSIKCSQNCTGITAVGTDLRPPNGTATYLCSHITPETGLDFPCTEV
ncbi:pectin lyase-like protein [Mrakia frigida]|uniref:pectin lyase-like protein n=1 Tax=Mrakia frigida TaxID=29902 RepID=UPI003FCBEF6E